MNNFSNLSIDITKQLSKNIKKDNGIFFTPFDIIKISIEELKKIQGISIKTILEPSCGSCQFIIYIDNDIYFKNISITAIENNKYIYDNIINNIKLNNNSINFINQSYLDYDINNNNTYDLIIGNPPYYVINETIKKNDKIYYDGRPNIFILFIINSLKKLNENGILLFILPKNFLNCLYYHKLRKHIYDNYTIINIIDCSKSNYIDTDQETIIFIIQNKKRNIKNDLFSIYINNYIIFNTSYNISNLKDIYLNSISLNLLNFEVKVGSLIWNQNKKLLTNDNTKTRLIYSSDIKDNSLILNKYKNDDKKNYINKKGNNELLLIVNRGYGKGNYKFNYCIIDVPYEYLIENHLIIIKYKYEINKEDLIDLYNKIINSFLNEKTIEFIKMYFGNNAINTTELQYILPIFL